MKGEWCYIRSYFSTEYCNDIVEKSKSLKFNDAFIGERGTTENDSYRKSRVAWLYPNSFPDLYQELWKLERQVNAEWFNFDVDNLEYVQFSEYSSEIQAEYKTHQDVFWINDTPRHRKLTAVVQLTDPNEYEGCELSLYECGQYPNPEEIKQQGTVIFFPSFVFHSVSPIISGTRNSLAVWFEGPKWR